MRTISPFVGGGGGGGLSRAVCAGVQALSYGIGGRLVAISAGELASALRSRTIVRIDRALVVQCCEHIGQHGYDSGGARGGGGRVVS